MLPNGLHAFRHTFQRACSSVLFEQAQIGGREEDGFRRVQISRRAVSQLPWGLIFRQSFSPFGCFCVRLGLGDNDACVDQLGAEYEGLGDQT